MQYNDASKQYYNQWSENLFAIFLAIIGFLIIILMMSLLQMTSQWRIEATGLFLVLAIARVLVILIIQAIRVRKIEKEWTSAIQEIANQQNSQYFERNSSKINADLTSLIITIGN